MTIVKEEPWVYRSFLGFFDLRETEIERDFSGLFLISA